jgi:hypothetical protein
LDHFCPKASQSIENKANKCDPAIFTCVLDRNEVKRGRRATAGARKGGRLGVHLRVSIHVEGLNLFRRHSIQTIDARLHVKSHFKSFAGHSNSHFTNSLRLSSEQQKSFEESLAARIKVAEQQHLPQRWRRISSQGGLYVETARQNWNSPLAPSPRSTERHGVV